MGLYIGKEELGQLMTLIIDDTATIGCVIQIKQFSRLVLPKPYAHAYYQEYHQRRYS